MNLSPAIGRHSTWERSHGQPLRARPVQLFPSTDRPVHARIRGRKTSLWMKPCRCPGRGPAPPLEGVPRDAPATCRRTGERPHDSARPPVADPQIPRPAAVLPFG